MPNWESQNAPSDSFLADASHMFGKGQAYVILTSFCTYNVMKPVFFVAFENIKNKQLVKKAQLIKHKIHVQNDIWNHLSTIVKYIKTLCLQSFKKH